jgi:hypothetical protein
MNIKQTKLLYLLLAAFICVAQNSYGQVYNFHPFSYNDIETNPSYIASSRIDSRFQLIHLNGFLTANHFTHNSLRFTKYFPKAFSGIGLSLNNTKYDNEIFYSHIGIGSGYRNVLFDKVYLRFGTMLKFIKINNSNIDFDYLSYKIDSQTYYKPNNYNYNISLSISERSYRYYITVSYSNIRIEPNTIKTQQPFPKYFIINAGNFLSFFNFRNASELSYSFAKILNSSDFICLRNEHYLDFKRLLKRSRYWAVMSAFRFGYTDYDSFSLSPGVYLSKKKLSFSISYNLHFHKKTLVYKQFSTSQINIIYTP